MERETGLEPATSSLGSWHSTTELLPLLLFSFHLPKAQPCPRATHNKLTITERFLVRAPNSHPIYDQKVLQARAKGIGYVSRI